MSNWPTWLSRTLMVFGSILVAGMGIALLLFLSERLQRYLNSHARALHVRQTEVLSQATLTEWLDAILDAVRAICVIAIGYAGLAGVLYGLDASHTLFARATDPLRATANEAIDQLVSLIPSAMMLFAIFAVTRMILVAARGFFRTNGAYRVFFPRLDPVLVAPTHKLVVFAVVLIAVLMAAPYLPGSGSRAFQGVTVFLGVMVSLGSSSLVGNLLSGIQLIYSRAFRVGDRVRIGEVYGDVIELGTFATKVRTVQNEEVTLPNTLVHTTSVTNFSRAPLGTTVLVETSVTIGYDTPHERVHALLLDAARATHGIAPSPPAFVLQRSLDDSYVCYQINAPLLDPQAHHVVRSALHENIQRTFFSGGVEICSPIYWAMRDGNRTTIPSSYSGDQVR